MSFLSARIEVGWGVGLGTLTAAIAPMVHGVGPARRGAGFPLVWGCRLGVVGFPFLSGLSLVALFFFCGVGVVDDEVVEAEGVGCFGGGDQAVDGLCVSGEGVGGGACPGGG